MHLFFLLNWSKFFVENIVMQAWSSNEKLFEELFEIYSGACS